MEPSASPGDGTGRNGFHLAGGGTERWPAAAVLGTKPIQPGDPNRREAGSNSWGGALTNQEIFLSTCRCAIYRQKMITLKGKGDNQPESTGSTYNLYLFPVSEESLLEVLNIWPWSVSFGSGSSGPCTPGSHPNDQSTCWNGFTTTMAFGWLVLTHPHFST